MPQTPMNFQTTIDRTLILFLVIVLLIKQQALQHTGTPCIFKELSLTRKSLSYMSSTNKQFIKEFKQEITSLSSTVIVHYMTT